MFNRICSAELMDDPNLEANLHKHALRELERLNGLSNSVNVLWTALEKFTKDRGINRLRIADIATGGGDTIIGLCKLALQNGKPYEFIGIDISSTAIDYARQKAKAVGVPVEFVQLDVINNKLPNNCDVFITSLFTHHLSPEQVVNLFQKMYEANGRLILINDLVRSHFSLLLIWIATRLFCTSPIVRYDGPISVRAAYTPDEMKQMAEAAHLYNCTVRHAFPCRQLLTWTRDVQN